MRQWAFVIALLLHLAGSGYASTARGSRATMPVPIERRIESFGGDGRTVLTLDWWRA